MADLFIVGQFYGVDSITAVANGSQVLHMLTVIIVGLAMGTTVAIGRAVGGRRLEDAAHAIGNTITLFMIVAVVFTAGLLCFVRPIVLFIIEIRAMITLNVWDSVVPSAAPAGPSCIAPIKK